MARTDMKEPPPRAVIVSRVGRGPTDPDGLRRACTFAVTRSVGTPAPVGRSGTGRIVMAYRSLVGEAGVTGTTFQNLESILDKFSNRLKKSKYKNTFIFL